MDVGTGGAAGNRFPMWEPVFLPHHQLRGGKGRGWKGVIQFCFKRNTLCQLFSTHF